MRILSLLGCFLASSVLVLSAEPEAPVVQGKLSAVRLMPVSRLQLDASATSPTPDGVTFHFIMIRQPGIGPLALKETRDVMVGGESYQAATKAKLGKQFEPETVVADAEKFFEQYPHLARFAPKERKGALAISVTIGGAELSAGKPFEVILHVGAGQQVEPFKFTGVVPGKIKAGK
ncbi:MAG: hypothetical protein ABIZ81_15465 [Opitutaceae bacterium]